MFNYFYSFNIEEVLFTVDIPFETYIP